MEDGGGEKNSGFKKLWNLFKKFPAAGGMLATASLYVLMAIGVIVAIIAIMQIITIAFSTISGVFEKMFTSGEYKDLTLEEMQDPNFDFGDCYVNQSDSGWDAFWSKIGDNFDPEINSECEFIGLVKTKMKKYETQYSEYGLEMSPGLAVSTIIYSYSSQPRAEGEEAVDPGQPMEVLADIVDKGIFDTDDVDDMISNMIFHQSFWYYSCDGTVTCTADGGEVTDDTLDEDKRSGTECKKQLFNDVYFSRDKFNIFLRYGKEVATAYEATLNHNSSAIYICDSCYAKWNDDENYKISLDQTKYLQLADESTKTADNISIMLSQDEVDLLTSEINSINAKTNYIDSFNIVANKVYTYKDGFIYTKFPNYQTSFESGNQVESEIYTPKNIEHVIAVNLTYEESINKVYGLGEIESGSKGKAQTSLFTQTKKTCPSEEACNCSNGGLVPTSDTFDLGIYTSTALFGNFDDEKFCNMLGSSSESKNLRLTVCAGYDGDTYLPGGGSLTTVNGEERYVAKEAISLEQYLKGLSVSEISGNYYPVEAVKFQMLIAQTYLLNSIQRNATKVLSSGEYLVKTGTCFQVYNHSKYTSAYLGGKNKGNIDRAYEAIKTQLLVDAGTSHIIFSEYGSKLQNTIKSMGDSGLSYVNMLNSDYIRNYSKGNGKNYANAEINKCGGASSEVVSSLIENARKFVGYTRQQMAAYFNTTDSWCARFVSYILKITPGSNISLSSSKVNEFVDYFRNSNRFCSSKYWYDKAGLYGCTGSPEMGDLIMFASTSCGYTGNGVIPSKSETCWRHIGIVSNVSADTVTYIHGNTQRCNGGKNGVCETTINLNDKEIIGYGR